MMIMKFMKIFIMMMIKLWLGCRKGVTQLLFPLINITIILMIMMTLYADDGGGFLFHYLKVSKYI